MPTETLPGERCVVLMETLKDLEEQLEAGQQIDDGVFNAISMLIVDATLDGDDQTLHEGIKRIKDLTHITKSGVRGRLLSYIDVITWAQRRIVPNAVLDELKPDTMKRRLLEAASTRGGVFYGDLLDELAGEELILAAAAEFLEGNYLITGRRGTGRSVWIEVTPKGRKALELTQS